MRLTRRENDWPITGAITSVGGLIDSLVEQLYTGIDGVAV